jgi:predicted RNase H-like nuclease (RuvC/YqgF family)
MTLSRFSEISQKAAAGIIGAVILAMGGITYANKLNKAEFEVHCISNERDFKQVQWELSVQRSAFEKQQQELEKVKEENQQLKIILEDINGKFNLIMHRLDRIERKIDK